MKTHTDYLIFNTKQRQQIIDITDKVEQCRASADIDDGMVLVSAMHISASVFVNDHEPNLWQDILQWLENEIAPWDPPRYPVTKARLDLGPWQRIFYGEWDGQRPKRVVLKAMGM